MELNATPLRTSKSFNINNIELNIDIPKNIKMFKNIELNKEVKQLEKNIVFKYGVGLDYKFSNHKIEIDSKDSDNINLIYNFDDENLNLINQILINAYGNSSITIEYKSKTNKNCWHNGGIKLIVNENASVNVNIINFLNENSYNFETIESELHKNSKANYTIIDIGGKYNSYCSDMTRTVFIGEEPSKEHAEVYNIVKSANEKAISIVKEGVKFSDIDNAARSLITEAGYGEYFTHRTGHSIGIEVHDFGDVSGVNHEEVKSGMIFSIEPGIYLKDNIGVRIEDLVLVTKDGCEVLNSVTKEIVVL